MNHIYDLLILGGGCAGLSAAIYAARDKLDTILLEKSHPGGQAVNTEEIVNYPGIRHITGPALMREMHLQAMDFGAEYRQAEAVSVDFSGTVKVVHTTDGIYQSRAVILATGASPRKIGFPGEDAFTGKGIFYCSNCTSFHGEQIFVLGGGYAAAEEAMFLTRFDKPVTIVVREDDFPAPAPLQNGSNITLALPFGITPKSRKFVEIPSFGGPCLRIPIPEKKPFMKPGKMKPSAFSFLWICAGN